MAGSYWDAPNGNCYAVIDAAVERFEREHPNVHVTYTSGILKRDYSEWLIDQYLLGSEPDVFLVLPEDFGTLCELGALEPLDGCLAQDKEVSDTDFYPAALQSGAENSVQYALPYECVPTLMCINKSLLESEGITVPSGDWTWEDFYNICAKVTRDTDGDGEIDQFGCCGYTWQDALTANGASLFTEDGGSCLISEPKAVRRPRPRHGTLMREKWRSGRSCSRITEPISRIRGASSGTRISRGTAFPCRTARQAATARS